jgi:hypothetical protein
MITYNSAETINKISYQSLVEAIREHQALVFRTGETNFKIGDRLLDVCGTVAQANVTRINRDKLKIVHQQLLDDKVCTNQIAWLKEMADVALVFPKSERIKDIHWSVHHEAGSPQKLKTLLAIHSAMVVKLSRKNATGRKRNGGSKKLNLTTGPRGTLRRYKEIQKNFPNAAPAAIPALAGAMANLRTADYYIQETIKLVVPQAKNLKNLDADSIKHLVSMCENVRNSANRCAALIDKATTDTNKPKLVNVA